MHVKYWINLFVDLHYRNGKYLLHSVHVSIKQQRYKCKRNQLVCDGQYLDQDGNQESVVEFQSRQSVPTNAGTEIHHPNIDIAPGAALNMPACTAARCCFWERQCKCHGSDGTAPSVRSCTMHDGLWKSIVYGFEQKLYVEANSLKYSATDLAIG